MPYKTMENYTRIMNLTNNPIFKMFNDMRNECYENNATHSRILETTYDEDGPWCGRKFDGWSCWDETPASTTAYQNCPGFIVGFDPNRIVQKICTENGSWYKPPNFHKSWTNYTTCVDMADLIFRRSVTIIYLSGYMVSVITLAMSIWIFRYFSSLDCIRIRVHTCLFISFVLSNIAWIVWYLVVIEQVDVVQGNEVWCQVLHIITEYLTATNYMWMLCESVHLHVTLMYTYVNEPLAMRIYLAIGWGLSFVIVMVYAIFRKFATFDTNNCWMDHSDAFYFIMYPVGLSLFISLLILINVISIIIRKYHTALKPAGFTAAKKATRATCFLVPLFGLHFMIIPLRPLPSSPGEFVYQVVAAVITSLQGLCVSVIYCFANGEVSEAFHTFCLRKKREGEAAALAGITTEESQEQEPAYRTS